MLGPQPLYLLLCTKDIGLADSANVQIITHCEEPPVEGQDPQPDFCWYLEDEQWPLMYYTAQHGQPLYTRHPIDSTSMKIETFDEIYIDAEWTFLPEAARRRCLDYAAQYLSKQGSLFVTWSNTIADQRFFKTSLSYETPFSDEMFSQYRMRSEQCCA